MCIANIDMKNTHGYMPTILASTVAAMSFVLQEPQFTCCRS